MRDRALELAKRIGWPLLSGAMLMLSSCAQKESPRLVDDPDARQESAIPWNKQEKWEQGQELSAMQGASSSDQR